MNPNQPQPGQPQTPPPNNSGYPPQYGSPQQQPQQQYSQPQGYNTAAPQNPYAQPAPPQQAPENWYTPTPKPNDSKPGDVSQYLQQSSPSTAQTNPVNAQNPATGQTINGQYAVDYLGGIAPAAPNNTVSVAGFQLTKKIIAIIVSGIVALIMALVVFFSTQTPQGPTTLNESSLYASFIDTADVTKDSSKNINDSQLRSLNGSFQTFLLNSATQMEEPLTKSGIDHTKLKTAAKKPPYHDDKMAAKLEDARLLDTYDRVYASEVSFKLQTMDATIQKIKKTNTRESMQSYLTETEKSLTVLQEALKKYENGEEES